MTRGDIYWCDLEPKRGHEQGDTRPVIVISASHYNASRSPLIAIIPLTRSASKNPLHVALSPKETGLRSGSTALIDHARFVDRTRFREGRIGRVVPDAQARIDRNLARVLALDSGGIRSAVGPN